MTQYDQLIQRLDRFIRKYYLNRLVRGLLYTSGLVLALFILFSVSEHYMYFGQGVRKGLYYGWLAASSAALSYWVLFPLAQYAGLGQLISHEKAADIIGTHFSDVGDKLLNILQLRSQIDTAPDQELVLASIEQKTQDIRLVPFKKAIDLGENKKYLRYAMIPLTVLIALLGLNSAMITDSTQRIMQNDRDFERPAPFHWIIEDNTPSVLQYQDLSLTVRTAGEAIPAEAYIEIDGIRYHMDASARGSFQYTLENLSESVELQYVSGSVQSAPIQVEVLPLPAIRDYSLQLDYPAYTGRRDETLRNRGNAVLPVGTKLRWTFDTEHTRSIDMRWGDQSELLAFSRDGDRFTLDRRVYNDQRYGLYTSNEHIEHSDSLIYSLSVIPDQYPTIQVEQFSDTTAGTLYFLVGDARDDYGLTDLIYHQIIYTADNVEKSRSQKTIKSVGAPSTQWEYQVDMETLSLEGGEHVEFYFEIWDNDGVHGRKSARSQVMEYYQASLDDLEEAYDETTADVEKNLQESLDKLRQLQEEMNRLREQMLQQPQLDYSSRQQMERLMQQRQQLQQQIQQAQKKFSESLQQQEQLQQASEQIRKDQENLQALMEELTPEEKALQEELRELMEKLDKEGALDEMKKMEMSDQEMEMELDRLLELFKTMDVEQEMEKLAEDLNKLADKQEKLSEKTGDKEENEQNTTEQMEQEEIQKELEKLQEKMDEIQEKNKELERPKSIDEPDEDMDSAEQDMENSQQQMKKGDNKKASKSQKNAAQKMRNSAEQMQSSMQGGDMQQMEEDIETLRQLLENLVTLSFDQEDLMAAFSRARVNTPHYVSLVQDQFKLQEDFRVVEDTLVALAKRNADIESFVMDKLLEVKGHLGKSVDLLEERSKSPAANDQQRAMKGINDLALMLSDAMENMQQQMAASMPGNQMCNKPGGSNPRPGNTPKDKMSGAQEQLNGDMQKMQQKMQNGYEGSAEDFAKLAARQGALREALKKLKREMQERGEGSGGQLDKTIDEMDQIETDLVHKQLTHEMLERQQEILTRLLEAEESERQRDLDDKRKSRTADIVPREMPPALQEYLRQRAQQIEEFEKVSPALRPFYKQMVEKYVRSAQSGK